MFFLTKPVRWIRHRMERGGFHKSGMKALIGTVPLRIA